MPETILEIRGKIIGMLKPANIIYQPLNLRNLHKEQRLGFALHYIPYDNTMNFREKLHSPIKKIFNIKLNKQTYTLKIQDIQEIEYF